MDKLKTKAKMNNPMPLTRDYKKTIKKRVNNDPEFAKALLDEAGTLFLNGEADVARLVLRDLVNSTVGFKALAEASNKNDKSIQRMLSATGNPKMDNLATIFNILREKLNLKIEVRTETIVVHQ